MGYKLAGFDVIGCCEIDPQMLAMYRSNHSPRLPYLMGVQQFKSLPDLPEELSALDVLDGSPPCSSFSTAGSRHKAWGTKKKFREGQAEQVLDDLFFDFIAVAQRLQPKLVVAENVKGLVTGKARGYVKAIFAGFASAGYECQLFLLNASRMGVPQARERTVFVARRKDLGFAPLKLLFEEKPIPLAHIKEPNAPQTGLSARELAVWKARTPADAHMGQINLRLIGKPTGFTQRLLRDERVCDTLIASDNNILYSEPRKLTRNEVLAVSTFPLDYNFCGQPERYVCGMSVPPFMMQRVADQLSKQWLAGGSDGAS